MFKVVCRHLTVIMFNESQVSHGLGEKAVKIICSVSGFLKVVMKNDCFRDIFRVEILVSVLWNKKPKVIEIAKQACDQICGVCDIWSI